MNPEDINNLLPQHQEGTSGSVSPEESPKPPAGANQEVDRMAEEVNQAIPQATWFTYIPKKQFGVEIILPHNCFITATLTYQETGGALLYIDMFQVNDQLQGRGVGTRLLKALVAEAKHYGASILSGNVTSNAALKTRAKVFGENNLTVFKRFDDQPLDTPFPDLLNKTGDTVDYVVRANLGNIDTSTWERPVDTDHTN